MNLKERMVTALNCAIPDSVPTFELEFQIEEEMFGKTFDYSEFTNKKLYETSSKERDILINNYVEHTIDLYANKLEYSSIPLPHFFDFCWIAEITRLIKKKTGDTIMVHAHGDGTYGLPDGNDMYEFAYRIADDFDGLISQAEDMAKKTIEKNKRLADAGVDLFVLCADYCYNAGPFISPDMFSQLISPFLKKITSAIKKEGAYAIKHTDGNIMPILDQLIECNPHAIHSIDPMAGVDIAEVKRIANSRIALCGNVNCALLQTGNDDEILASCEYAMNHGKPSGGFIFTTSNVPFKGLDPHSYELVLAYWKKHRMYAVTKSKSF